MILKFLERLKHSRRIDLELSNLHILLLDGWVRNGAHEGEVVLDAAQVLLGRDAGQQRKLALNVRRLGSDKDGELLRLNKVRAPCQLSHEEV